MAVVVGQTYGNKRRYVDLTVANKAPKRSRMVVDLTRPSGRWSRAMSSRGLNRRGVASKETGYVDLALANYPLDTTGSVTLIATIAQGTAVTQRVGKKVLLKSIQIRGSVSNNSAATVNDVAYLIVYDRRPTGSLPAVTDILDTASSRSMNNDANSGRFKILRRVDCALVGNITTYTESTMKSIDDYIKLNKLPMVFKAAGTGAIGDIEEGALYLVTVGMSAAGTAAAQLSAGFRTRFVDV